jgi:hypothetical protein
MDPVGPPKPGSRPAPLAPFAPPSAPAITRTEIAAVALSLIWLAVCGLVLFFDSDPDAGAVPGGFQRLLIAATAVLPVVMIWFAAKTLRALRAVREEGERLRLAIDAIRRADIAAAQGGAGGDTVLIRKLDKIAASTRNTETALANFAKARTEPPPRDAPPMPAPQDPPEQPALALEPAPAVPSQPPGTADLIRALNFPESAQDTEGFSALRRALRDRATAQVIQASEDVLTLLSQDGIYMDDLAPDRARPEIWRQFAQGLRGRQIAGLGGIHDRTSLALTSGRMRQDPIFRDAAHHFLRKFDHSFAAWEPELSDAEISALADTRTARAFMLLGRAAGTFD